MKLPAPEVIGDPDCPILHRWTLIGGHRGGESRVVSGNPKPAQRFKLLLHHFLPNSDDRHLHDHPRPFLTFVLRGSYTDYRPCGICHGSGDMTGGGRHGDGDGYCFNCLSTGMVRSEEMTPGRVRFRPAHYVHRTRASRRGCWTLVLMGPLTQPWGFFVKGHWWPWKQYEKEFGAGMRCE